MSRGHTRPLTVCDSLCAGANGCRVGGYQCDGCGLWFCGEDLERVDDRHLCEDCAEEYGMENEDDSEGTNEGPEALPEAGHADEGASRS